MKIKACSVFKKMIIIIENKSREAEKKAHETALW